METKDSSTLRPFRFQVFLRAEFWDPRCRKELFWQLEANATAHQPKPDNEICLGVDAMPVRDVTHGVRSIARMDKKSWCSGYWMILRYMSQTFQCQGYWHVHRN
jgi:hypothetical protein